MAKQLEEFEKLDAFVSEAQKDLEEIMSEEEKKSDENDYYTDDAVSMYLREISRYPLMTKEEEYKTAVLAKAGDPAAREKMIVSNLRLVVAIARKFSIWAKIPLLDLVQEGNIGLTTAVSRFDPEKGFRFTTYASWWIYQGISRSVDNSNTMIRLPVHFAEKQKRVRRVIAAFVEKHHREPSVEEIANLMHESVQSINLLLSYMTDTVSLDLAVGEDSDTTLGDFVVDEKASSLETMVENKIMAETLMDAVQRTLTDREREILEMRFGLNGKDVLTLNEIGDMYGITRERVRQIEKKALKKLTSWKTKRALADFA